MLFTTLYVSLILLYWTESITSRRITWSFLSLATVISVTANIIRNTILTLFHGTGQDAAFVWLHDGWGGDVYSGCMLLSLIPLLNWINYNFLPVPPTEMEVEQSIENPLEN
ncbi:MAG: hypothetical protein F6K62_17345 [Sphaerospermopsis sp. SIO1G2]|nr:hypothetical protein [Sphaerospermopsis sp. SIO1G2]